MPGFEDRLYAALREAGMPDVPVGFSVALVPQVVPRALLAAIESFIRVFDRVTTRPAWQDAMTAGGPAIARPRRSEVCFFSAWDFHLPPECPDRFQLIECNDNGSGMLFAAILNRIYYDLSGIGEHRALVAPPSIPAFGQRVLGMIRLDARTLSEEPSPGLVLNPRRRGIPEKRQVQVRASSPARPMSMCWMARRDWVAGRDDLGRWTTALPWRPRRVS